MPKCKVPDCENPSRIRSVCEKHYQRFKKHGTYDGLKYSHAPPEERFWRFVEAGPKYQCWLWRGTKSSYGYGQLKISENPVRFKRAHRLSYEIHKGPISPDDVIMHSCDTPLCVNPHHLAKGTQTDNIADKMAKGRYVAGNHQGPRNGRAIMTPDDIHKIRQSDESYAKLAAKFGVSKGTIAAIVTKRNWSHID